MAHEGGTASGVEKYGTGLRVEQAGDDSVMGSGSRWDPYSNRAKQTYSVDLASYNASAMVGRYHAYKLESKFPVPGAAVMDDFKRRQLATTADELDHQLEDTFSRRRELVRIEREIAQGREGTRAPSKLEKLFENLDNAMEERESTVRDISQDAPRMPSSDVQHRAFQAIKSGDMTLLEQMFDFGEVNVNAAEDHMQTTGLMMSCSRGEPKAVRLFLRFGADPNQYNTTGLCAIHMIWHSWVACGRDGPPRQRARENMKRILSDLLGFEADPNIRNHHGMTALHMAAQYGHDDLAVLLLRGGGDPSLRDRRGRQAVDLARSLVQRNPSHTGARALIRLIGSWDTIRDSKKSQQFRSAWMQTLADNAAEIRAAVSERKFASSADAPRPAEGTRRSGLTTAEQLGDTARRNEVNRMFASSEDATRVIEEMDLDEHVRERTRTADQQKVQLLPYKRLQETRRAETAAGVPGAAQPLLLDKRDELEPLPEVDEGVPTMYTVGGDTLTQGSGASASALAQQATAVVDPYAKQRDSDLETVVRRVGGKKSGKDTAESAQLFDPMVAETAARLAHKRRLWLSWREQMQMREQMREVEATSSRFEAYQSGRAVEGPGSRLRQRRREAARGVLEDAQADPLGADRVKYTTGEVYVRQPALASARLRPRRARAQEDKGQAPRMGFREVAQMRKAGKAYSDAGDLDSVDVLPSIKVGGGTPLDAGAGGDEGASVGGDLKGGGMAVGMSLQDIRQQQREPRLVVDRSLLPAAGPAWSQELARDREREARASEEARAALQRRRRVAALEGRAAVGGKKQPSTADRVQEDRRRLAAEQAARFDTLVLEPPQQTQRASRRSGGKSLWEEPPAAAVESRSTNAYGPLHLAGALSLGKGETLTGMSRFVAVAGAEAAEMAEAAKRRELMELYTKAEAERAKPGKFDRCRPMREPWDTEVFEEENLRGMRDM